MPRKVDGPVASAHNAAITGVSSPTSCKSTSMPLISDPPVTTKSVPSRETVAPSFGSRLTSASPACVVCVGQSGIATDPPQTSAAARNGAALDKSGSTVTLNERGTPGWTVQVALVESLMSTSTRIPSSRKTSTDISMCGIDGNADPE